MRSRIRSILAEQRAELKRLQRAGSARALEVTREALENVQGKLARIPDTSSWDYAAHTAMVRQLGVAVQHLGISHIAGTQQAVKDAARLGWEQTRETLEHLDLAYTGAVRSLRFDSVEWLTTNSAQLSKVRLQEFRRSFQRYGAATVHKIENAVARTVLTGTKWSDVRDEVWDHVRSVVQGQQWMVDRILRTETSAMVNGIRLAALLEEDNDPRDPLYKRLVATFDSRTGKDSIMLHGQIRPLREPFYDAFHGKHYQAPPNRPNDREVLIGWRASYGQDFDKPDPEPTPTAAQVSEAVLPTDPARTVSSQRRPARNIGGDGPVEARKRLLREARSAVSRTLLALQAKMAQGTVDPQDNQRARVLERRLTELDQEARSLDSVEQTLSSVSAVNAEQLAVLRKIKRGDRIGPSPVLETLLRRGYVRRKRSRRGILLVLTALALSALKADATSLFVPPL